MNSVKTGKLGENSAVKYLETNGFEVLARNYYIRGGEVDIIYRDGEYTVFGEVKARSSTAYGFPAQAVTKQKIKRICKAAKTYALKHNLMNAKLRFDVIEVYIETKEIKIIKNAFLYTD